jgi:phosphatidylcholine synthase
MDIHAHSSQPSRSQLAAAVFVHIFTATGAVLAYIGTHAVFLHQDRRAFAVMFAATVIDAIDGALARFARVREVLPAIDGARIDDIVDYLTFVFLPMLLIDRAGGLPVGLELPLVAVVLVSSAFGFSSSDAKTSDHYFTGFPSYWNIVVLYLYVFRMSPTFNAAVLVILSGMIFVRTRYVYPSRTPRLRLLTMILGWSWGVALGLMIWWLPAPPGWLTIVSLVFPVYYFVLSFVLNARGARVRAA